MPPLTRRRSRYVFSTDTPSSHAWTLLGPFSPILQTTLSFLLLPPFPRADSQNNGSSSPNKHNKQYDSDRAWNRCARVFKRPGPRRLCVALRRATRGPPSVLACLDPRDAHRVASRFLHSRSFDEPYINCRVADPIFLPHSQPWPRPRTIRLEARRHARTPSITRAPSRASMDARALEITSCRGSWEKAHLGTSP